MSNVLSLSSLSQSGIDKFIRSLGIKGKWEDKRVFSFKGHDSFTFTVPRRISRILFFSTIKRPPIDFCYDDQRISDPNTIYLQKEKLHYKIIKPNGFANFKSNTFTIDNPSFYSSNFSIILFFEYAHTPMLNVKKIIRQKEKEQKENNLLNLSKPQNVVEAFAKESKQFHSNHVQWSFGGLFDVSNSRKTLVSDYLMDRLLLVSSEKGVKILAVVRDKEYILNLDKLYRGLYYKLVSILNPNIGKIILKLPNIGKNYKLLIGHAIYNKKMLHAKAIIPTNAFRDVTAKIQKGKANSLVSESMIERFTKEEENTKREDKPPFNYSKRPYLPQDIGESTRIVKNTIFIVSNKFSCMSNNHVLETVEVGVPVSRNNHIRIFKIPMGYCKQCKKYYIFSEIYDELLKPYQKERNLLAKFRLPDNRIVGLEYASSSSEWKKESPLMQCGYNVNASEDLSEHARESILHDIIRFNILRKEEIKSYLNFFITNFSKRPNMEMACSKWRTDLLKIDKL